MKNFSNSILANLKIFFNNTSLMPSTTLPEPEQLPPAWDWRVRNVVTNVKTQGPCESSWAFATAGAVEGCHAIVGNPLVSLSAQNLMDCSWKDGNEGCNGGVVTQAMNYIINNAGIDGSAAYPYRGVNENCNFRRRFVSATITGYYGVLSGSEVALQSATLLGPTAVTFDANHDSFRFYQSGVYFEPTCSATTMNHCSLVVGWGNTTGPYPDYWIVKNSWGVGWGMSGYIMMARNANNNCGIATMPTIPTC